MKSVGAWAAAVPPPLGPARLPQRAEPPPPRAERLPLHQGTPLPSALAGVLTAVAPPRHRAPRGHSGAQTLGPLHGLPSTRSPAALMWFPWPGQRTPRRLLPAALALPIGLQAGVSAHRAAGKGAPADGREPFPMPHTSLSRVETPDASRSRSLVGPRAPGCLSQLLSQCVQPTQGCGVRASRLEGHCPLQP